MRVVRPRLAPLLRAAFSFCLWRALTPRLPASCRYKILFIVVGLAGLYFTRGLYSDGEVTYRPRNQSLLVCDCCGFRTAEQQKKSRK